MKSLTLLLLLATATSAIQITQGCSKDDPEELDDHDEPCFVLPGGFSEGLATSDHEGSSCCHKHCHKKNNKHHDSDSNTDSDSDSDSDTDSDSDSDYEWIRRRVKKCCHNHHCDDSHCC